MAFMLKREVTVAADHGRPDWQPNQLVRLDRGTALDDIAESELAQLSPDHFVDGDVDEDGRPLLAEDGTVLAVSDAKPEDWRDMSEPGRLPEE